MQFGEQAQIFPLPPLPPTVEKVRIGFLASGKWHWSEYSPSQASSAAANPPLERRQQLPTPRVANERRVQPAAPARQEDRAMTMGRDPHRFLFTFGKYRGQYVEDICATQEGQAELYEWIEYWQKEIARATRGDREAVFPGIEVAVVMAEQALLDLQFVPKPKYKTPRKAR